MTKILLVDDVPLSVDMQKSALSRAECEIFTAHSGKDAMEIVYRESPDLIVLDYFMPEMSGDVCCRKIKSDDSLKDTPVIMLTMEGTDADQDKAKCYAAGCDDFLTKPFKANDFLKKVEKYLDITVREYARTPSYATVSYMTQGVRFEGVLHDLGTGGMFIETDSPHQKGALLKIQFPIPSTSTQVEVEGRVVRTVEKSDTFLPGLVFGMGIQFTHMDSEARGAIEDFVAKK